MKISKADLEVLTNLMLEYSKEKGFPFYDKIIESSVINNTIFSSLSREEYYDNLLAEYVNKKIESSSNTKMGKLLKELYKYNKTICDKFIRLNLTREFGAEFQAIGQEVKDKLQDIENELFKSIEQSQYKSFSNGLYKKYESLIKSLFPYLNNVGVIVR